MNAAPAAVAWAASSPTALGSWIWCPLAAARFFAMLPPGVCPGRRPAPPVRVMYGPPAGPPSTPSLYGLALTCGPFDRISKIFEVSPVTSLAGVEHGEERSLGGREGQQVPGRPRLPGRAPGGR